MKNYKKTIIGTGIILGVLLISFLYPLLGSEDYNKQILQLDNQANVVGKAPFPPSFQHPFGTDENGQDILLMMIDGVKYTLLAAFVVTILRILLGGTAGIILSFWLPKFIPYFKDLFLGFRYVPALIIAITFMTPFALYHADNPIPMMDVMTYQVFILFLIAFPAVTTTTIEIIGNLRSQTFIQSSYLMGASHWFIIRKHLSPYFKSLGLLIGVQQLLSTIVLIMHLGLFEFFLGGQTAGGTFGYEKPPKAASLSSEWAGLIGQNFRAFVHYPWLVLTVMLGFFFLIGIINMIKRELEENMNPNYLGYLVQSKGDRVTKRVKVSESTLASFVFTSYPLEQENHFSKNERKRGRKKILYGAFSTGITFLLLLGVTLGMAAAHERQGPATEAEKKAQTVAANGKPKPDFEVPKEPTEEERKQLEKVAREFNFADTVNKTEKEVKERWGEPEKVRKAVFTFEGNRKEPGTIFIYSNSEVKILFIQGKAQYIELFVWNEYCDFFSVLPACLKSKGIDANQFDTSPVSLEKKARIKHAYHVGAFEFIEIERMGTDIELVSRILAVTQKKYFPIIDYEYTDY